MELSDHAKLNYFLFFSKFINRDLTPYNSDCSEDDNTGFCVARAKLKQNRLQGAVHFVHYAPRQSFLTNFAAKNDYVMLSERIKDMIAERFGREIRYSQDCEALSEDIFSRTGERLGVSTLKRMFGFTAAVVEARPSTMDIIAQYLGYGNGYKGLSADLGNDSAISAFDTLDAVDITSLGVDTRILLTYSPKRRIVMTYKGEGWFAINESENSKLVAGDIIRVANLTVGFELHAADVIRDGRSLGAYRAAKSGGLTTIDIID